MKARKIVNTMNTYYTYQDKIARCVAKKNELSGWEDDYGVLEMEKKIKHLQKELGQFLDREV